MVPGLTVVMAVKQLDRAKSRLAHAGDRRALVLAMFEDTLDAVAAADVPRIVVVSPDPLILDRAGTRGAVARRELDRPGAGLNAALRHGAAQARDDVLYLQADLPALRSESLVAAIKAAQAHPASFVADRHRTGTALVYVARGTRFTPAFGPDSADAHRLAGAVELDPAQTRWPDLRCDVDTAVDLAACLRLGVGRRTSAVTQAAHADDGRRDRVR
ncbi:MAG: 2-phospho-L-lactate guanylyltransferase [Gordonia sp. (in: high G+C Gram-positive bacteria)]|uniref:2-phospho-L-lactate guanylyltransferase n=1 Tax=Gordonia sp. (in: high G+C Gram-positive bacteria) TaxID=84139 RepID=UPI003BB5C832